MRRIVCCATLLVFAASLSWAGEGEASESPDPWVGKSRDEIVAGWGKPTKTKKRGKKEVLVYEMEMFVGEFYHAGDEGYSADISVSKKDEDGKRKVEVETEGVTQAPVYETLKFKFWLDETGRVVKTDFPKKAKTYIPPK